MEFPAIQIKLEESFMSGLMDGELVSSAENNVPLVTFAVFSSSGEGVCDCRGNFFGQYSELNNFFSLDKAVVLTQGARQQL